MKFRTFLFLATWAILTTLAAQSSFAEVKQFPEIEVRGLSHYRDGRSVTAFVVVATPPTLVGELPRVVHGVGGKSEPIAISERGTAVIPAFAYAAEVATGRTNVPQSVKWVVLEVHPSTDRPWLNDSVAGCPRVSPEFPEANSACTPGQTYQPVTVKTLPIERVRAEQLVTFEN